MIGSKQCFKLNFLNNNNNNNNNNNKRTPRPGNTGLMSSGG